MPIRRVAGLVQLDDHTIVSGYGLVQNYLLAGDAWRFNRVRWVMETSMLKTLAARHRSTVSKMARKYKAKLDTLYGPRTCFQISVERPGRKPLVARFGGIPLKRQKKAVLQDRVPVLVVTRRKELIERPQAGRLELCEHPAQVEVHQIRKLAHLIRPGRPQPAWARIMARRRRKTLVVCRICHDRIHARQPTATLTA